MYWEITTEFTAIKWTDNQTVVGVQQRWNTGRGNIGQKYEGKESNINADEVL